MFFPRKTATMTLSAMMLALCFILPYLTGSHSALNTLLLPMHLPIFLCGFLCGPVWGATVGFVAPVLRSITLGMPPSMVIAIPMSFEMAAYGGICGGIFLLLRKKNLATLPSLYAALIPSLILGRLVYAVAKAAITLSALHLPGLLPYVVESIVTSLPGVMVQLILVPGVVLAVERYRAPKLEGVHE